MIYFDISEEIPFYCYNFLFLCILNNVNRYQSRIFSINTKGGGGCQLTQILCIKFTSFLNSLCTIALFTSFWVTCSIFSVTNECCALIYSVVCKPFYVQIENNFFFYMVYYCVSFDLLRDASNVFSFSHSHTNIHLIWIKLEETLSMFMSDYSILLYISCRYFRQRM